MTILTTVKRKLKTYCATKYARSGIHQMWILKTLKECLANVETQNFLQINSIKTYDFSTIYTTIPHENLNLDFLISLTTVSLTEMGKRKY
jgi:hypothetical protein